VIPFGDHLPLLVFFTSKLLPESFTQAKIACPQPVGEGEMMAQNPNRSDFFVSFLVEHKK